MKKYLNSVEEVVKALNNGKRIYSKGYNINEYWIEKINGFICCNKNENGNFLINVQLIFSKGFFYTEEPEQLKFEVNKLYKTSKNKKAFLYKIVKGADFMYYFSSEDGCFTTNENGVFYNFGLPTDNKIVGYWEEEK